jgi:hypothetical protein
MAGHPLHDPEADAHDDYDAYGPLPYDYPLHHDDEEGYYAPGRCQKQQIEKLI